MPKPSTDEGLFRAVSQFLADCHGVAPSKRATFEGEVTVLHDASQALGLPIGSEPDPNDPSDPMKARELYCLDYQDIRHWIALCSDPNIVEKTGQVFQAHSDVTKYVMDARQAVIGKSKILFPTVTRIAKTDLAVLFGMMADTLAATRCSTAEELARLATDVDALSDPRFGSELGRKADFERKVAYLVDLAAEVPSMSDPTRKADLAEFIERVQNLGLDAEHGESRIRAVLDNAIDDPNDRLDALEHEAEEDVVRGPLEEEEDQEREEAKPGEHPH